ncbi:MAG: hypothetical protein AAGF11_43865 [Myxococcota bacterium]
MLTLSRNGALLVDDEYSLDYSRDKKFHGDERCGSCDLAQVRETTWTQ